MIVFIDYQNVHLTAHSRFQPTGTSPGRAQIDPVRLALVVVGKRNTPSELVGVRVYRGHPTPDRQPAAAAAHYRQASVWSHDPLVTVVRRPFRYSSAWPNVPPQEKGIDVALAVDFVRLAVERRYDVGVIASRDTDLVPAVETVVGLKLARVEVASWVGASRMRLVGGRGPWCHHLDREDYLAVLDPTDYTQGPVRR